MTSGSRLQRALLNTALSNSDLFDLPQSIFDQQLAIGLLLEPEGVCIFDHSFWSPHLSGYMDRFRHEPEGSWISAAFELFESAPETSPITILRKIAGARTIADIFRVHRGGAFGHYDEPPQELTRLSKIDLTGRLVDPQNNSEKIVDTLTEIFATSQKDYFRFYQENRERFSDYRIGQWLSGGFEAARRAFEECAEAYGKNEASLPDGQPGTDIRVSDMLRTVYRHRFGEILKPEKDAGMRRIIMKAWPGGPEREQTLALFRFLAKLYGRRDAAQHNVAINDQSISDITEFFLAAHGREAHLPSAPVEDFEFQMPSPSILVETKGSYFKTVRGSPEFTEYQEAWREWHDRQGSSPEASKNKLKEKLRAYAKKMVAEIKPEHMRHAYMLDPTKVRSQTLVRLVMTENAHIAKYVSGAAVGGVLTYLISRNPLLSAAASLVSITMADALSDPRVRSIFTLTRERVLSQTAFITSDAAGNFRKAGYRSS